MVLRVVGGSLVGSRRPLEGGDAEPIIGRGASETESDAHRERAASDRFSTRDALPLPGGEVEKTVKMAVPVLFLWAGLGDGSDESGVPIDRLQRRF